MAIRVLYLTFLHTMSAGQGSTLSSLLVQAFQEEFDQMVVVHMVVDDGTRERAVLSFLNDVIYESEVRETGLNVIYCEGGILSGCFVDEKGRAVWKIREQFAADFVQEGNILIVPDIDRNVAQKGYPALEKLCGFGFIYGETGKDYKSPIYFVDMGPDSSEVGRTISITKPSCEAKWLRPCFDGISQLLVAGPLEISARHDGLAYIVSETAGTLCNDMWWSPPSIGIDRRRLIYHPNTNDPGLFYPFASVFRHGFGFVVAITGTLSTDRLVKKCPDNAQWIINLIRHLRTEATSNIEKAAFSRFRGVRLFLSHRSLDKPMVIAVGEALKRRGPRIWLDKEQILPSDSVGISIDGGLDSCSHFVLFWSKHCVDAPWVRLELGAAIHSCIERRKPIFVVKLDDTRLPPIVDQFLRISGSDTPEEIARQIADSIAAKRRRV